MVDVEFVVMFRAGYNCHGYNPQGLDYYGTTAGYDYTCTTSTWPECIDHETSSQGQIKVVTFAPGKRCEEVNCKEDCGCQYGHEEYKPGESFNVGCQECQCGQKGDILFECTTMRRRKEIRDLTQTEWQKFQIAVKKLARTPPYPSKWHNLTAIHSLHAQTAHRSGNFLPWYRYFIHSVETELRTIDCDVTIPYFDWTLDVGTLQTSQAWQANAFGGNGDGPDQCVQYHPFKDSYPYYWIPCLRRQFNTSIHLPDIVDITHILWDRNFTNFQLHLEAASALFHLWVGGHMASHFSPFDPVFLAHHAYIDKLWDEWQKINQPYGWLQFPSNQRYVPMAPYKTTPDDVFNSERQLCVVYIELTEGAPCHPASIPNFGYDAQGYDHHNLDRFGYNRDGYNTLGVDKQNQPDSQGIFDANGYDTDGYHRSGFDSIGFDRFGYFNDSFNRDGYDGLGYDRLGYDRYGFDINGRTPFGFFRNGSYDYGINSSAITAFDRFGYNVFVINKYGMKRYGYDIYGFDFKFKDKKGCTYYFKGPFYVLHMKKLKHKLGKMDDLLKIPRICKAVTSVPKWWYDNMYGGLTQYPDNFIWHQRPLVTNYQLLYRPYIDQHNLWMPLPPNER